jgi:hypothetical protein
VLVLADLSAINRPLAGNCAAAPSIFVVNNFFSDPMQSNRIAARKAYSAPGRMRGLAADGDAHDRKNVRALVWRLVQRHPRPAAGGIDDRQSHATAREFRDTVKRRVSITNGFDCRLFAGAAAPVSIRFPVGRPQAVKVRHRYSTPDISIAH